MDALYFPHLSLPPSTWVNPALLFFDRLCLIAPDGGGLGLFDDRTRELIDLELARTVVPRGDWNSDHDDRFLSYVLGRASTVRPGETIGRIHLGKLAYTRISEGLVDAALLYRADDFWLEGPDWVVAHMMSYLALQLSSQSHHPLPLVTDERTSSLPVQTQDGRAVSRRLKSVSHLLPVPPNARPRDIVRFRERHRGELDALRDYLNTLIGVDPHSEAGDARFEERLRDAKRVRDHLVNEMAAFNWQHFGPTLAVALATTAAPFIEQSPWSTAAGAFGVALVTGQALVSSRRRHRAAGSPLIYATRVVGRWGPSAEQTLW